MSNAASSARAEPIQLAELDLTVAVLTFRRPHDLATILPLLGAQLRAAGPLLHHARILVVDNSPDGEARAAVAGFAGEQDRSMPESPGTVAYEHEPTPGIPAARNRALDASAGDDLLVFIDDDERPGQTWLALLLETFVEHSAVAVVGSVRSVYEAAPSAWVQAGRFFERRRPRTGTSLSVAATNNLLLDLRVVRRLGLAFDRRMGLNGGDDTCSRRTGSSRADSVVDEAVSDVIRARVRENEYERWQYNSYTHSVR